jgi:hypothetical protein
MKEPRNHLPGDLKALRYLDALDAGDLEAVSALWDEAGHDPELERMLTELDGAMFQEIPGDRDSLPGRPGRRRHRRTAWGVAVGTLAAACLLAILAWPRRDTEDRGPSPPMSRAGKEVANQPPEASHGLPPRFGARRDLDEAAMPSFVWPLENRLSASTPLDLLD